LKHDYSVGGITIALGSNVVPDREDTWFPSHCKYATKSTASFFGTMTTSGEFSFSPDFSAVPSFFLSSKY